MFFTLFSADAVAYKLGIDRVIAQVLPQEKEQVIFRLESERKKVVVMVGDGINGKQFYFQSLQLQVSCRI
jgi:cation transport ATPase